MSTAGVAGRFDNRLRWTRAGVVTLMFSLSVISYFDRTIMSIAGPSLMTEFDISPTKMGVVYSAFLLSYTLLMIPAGRLADRFGPRTLLAWMAFGSALFTALVAVAGKPGLGSLVGILPSLLVIRLCTGVFTSPLYPTCGKMNANWAPAHLRSRVQAFINAGAGVGGALSPILFAAMIRAYGWRMSFVAAGAATAILGAIWVFYARDYPSQHPALRGVVALDPPEARTAGRGAAPWGALLRNRSLRWLTVGYFMIDYFEYIFFYWIYYYLREVRHLGAGESAVYTTVLFSAWVVITPVGGWVADRMTRRFGTHQGLRWFGMSTLAASAVLLCIGANASETWMAVACMSLALGLTSCSDVAFWTATIGISGKEVGAACAIMNTGGNAGGFLAPIVTPLIAASFGWAAALYFGSLVAVAALLTWIPFDPAREQVPRPAAVREGVSSPGVDA